MKSRPLNPLRLDVATMAADGASLQGQWPLVQLPRLLSSCLLVADQAPPDVHWSVQGERRKSRPGAEADNWLLLHADAVATLECQRCLQPMAAPLSVDREFRFVRSEEEAEAQDIDSEEDVLALPRFLDLRSLVEDELLLELPLVPRHDVCPEPLPLPADEPLAEEEEAAPRPFAGLAALKKDPPAH
jgi:uncharacterized protein